MQKIAFICVHNSCRSQIAEALGNKILAGRYECYSAGTEIKDSINEDAVRVLKELYNIDMVSNKQYSKLIDSIPKCDIYVSMGCNVSCPNIEGGFTYNWGLVDPTGESDDVFIKVIKEIEINLNDLLVNN